MFQLETRSATSKALRGRRIKRVEFGTSEGEVRSLALHLDDGSSVVISATAWQALGFEQS